MGALSEIYVNPAIAGNSGTGTIGDPFGDVQYALNTATRDATNGNRINIKAGTAEVLTASLSYTTWGSPTQIAPTVFQGYTSAAGDGGKGDLNGNAGGFIISNNKNFVHFRDLILRNVGAVSIVVLGSGSECVDCEIHTSTGTNCIQAGDSQTVIAGCYIYNTTGYVRCSGQVIGNYLLTGPTNNFASFALTSLDSAYGLIYRNIITVTGAARGIYSAQSGSRIMHNSVLCTSAGTSHGISVDETGFVILNNLIEGFSGVGGAGIQVNGQDVTHMVGNAVYNCTTAYGTFDVPISGDNETLGATPFAKSGSNTFANRNVYFAPVAAVQGTAYPSVLRMDKGAVQHVDPAGGGGSGGGIRLAGHGGLAA